MTMNCIMLGQAPEGFEALENYIGKMPFVRFDGSFDSMTAAHDYLSNHKVDVLLIGNKVSEMQQPRLALLEPTEALPVVVLCNVPETPQLVSMKAVELVRKPFSYNHFHDVLQRIHYAIRDSRDFTLLEPQYHYFVIRSDDRLLKIDYNQLQYVEVMDDHILLHMIDQQIATTEKLDWIVSRLPAGDFLRVHRWYVVNVNHVIYQRDNYVVIGRNKIPVTIQAAAVIAARLKDEQ
ncbi:MAG TPA: LytTR family transcriptional regulator DNA-binding domain-containing protein [Chitinophaga sp.]|uniref:LytR/AlgR family response regulator transcription factor n=1 Tax=Chitinophaga sp. TaxID=1869181 RepID=UPI002B89DC70|nr:LytTR family transcriptional regulator DNA-binding domain-containing protein [Chitinophaga sp.]HVI46790.1 LytTR family transcriptional regulator DNA-binding domain-containing protein [Chitinophaga sp.]